MHQLAAQWIVGLLRVCLRKIFSGISRRSHDQWISKIFGPSVRAQNQAMYPMPRSLLRVGFSPVRAGVIPTRERNVDPSFKCRITMEERHGKAREEHDLSLVRWRR